MNSSRTKNKYSSSYAFSRESIPYPEVAKEKAKPPITELESEDNSGLFTVKEATLEEQGQKFMDDYRKVERAIVCNFYTGGGVYTRGILDSLYKGFNPLNPSM